MQIISNTYLKETLALKGELERNFILLSERLYLIYTERVWQDEGYGSFDEFLMELKMNRQTASKLITVYRTYVIKHGIALAQLFKARSWESLYDARSLAIDNKKAIEVVESSSVLSRNDMRNMVNGEPNCPGHEWYSVKICKNCNIREKIYDTNMPPNNV